MVSPRQDRGGRTESPKEALLMESFCLLQLQRPAEAIDILEPVEMQAGSPEPLLASAYRMTGNDQEAKRSFRPEYTKRLWSY